MQKSHIGYIFIALLTLLAAVPCQGGEITPAASTPTFQLANPPDITVAPIAYAGPQLSDIGMKLITYHGPDLSDITLDPIVFDNQSIAIAKKPALQMAAAPPNLAGSVARAAQRLPGVQPGLKILSPKPGQTLTGSVPLEVEITGWQGVPRVDLAWWWSPAASPGQWPATPQGMTVREHLNGQTRIIIPRAAFAKPGLWRLQASVKLSDTRQVIDDVSFTLAGPLQPIVPKPKVPGAVTSAPAATGSLQPQQAAPNRATGMKPIPKDMIKKQ